MSSTLVGYSSGEDEYGSEKKSSGQRQSDANYDDVQMDMSDDEEATSNTTNSQLFASKEDFKAYNEQFSSSQARMRDNTPSTEYGTSTVHKSHHAGHSNLNALPDKFQRKDSYSSDNDTDRYKDLESDSSSAVKSSSLEDRSKSHKSRHHSPESSRNSSSRKHHRKGDYRRRSRSRSRSRDRKRSRRSRSRSPRGDRRYRKSSRSRERDRNRKLHSMGLTGPETTRSYESQLEKVKEITGVEVPKYYNPSAINPLRYAEQIKKRQMLWSKKPSETFQSAEATAAAVAAAAPTWKAVNEAAAPAIEPKPNPATSSSSTPVNNPMLKTSYNKWETTNFGNDKANEKFRRLMGIKNAGAVGGNESTAGPSCNAPKWFEDQEKQYEKARAVTHTQRGLGLGFADMAAAAASAPVPPHSAAPVNKFSSTIEKKPLAFVKK